MTWNSLEASNEGEGVGTGWNPLEAGCEGVGAGWNPLETKAWAKTHWRLAAKAWAKTHW